MHKLEISERSKQNKKENNQRTWRLFSFSRYPYVITLNCCFFLKSYDCLEITNEHGELFGLLCGWAEGTHIFEIGGDAHLTFHSDSEVQEKGFNLSFAAVPMPGEFHPN